MLALLRLPLSHTHCCLLCSLLAQQRRESRALSLRAAQGKTEATGQGCGSKQHPYLALGYCCLTARTVKTLLLLQLSNAAAAMSDLQRAMTASQPALAGAGPSRRGVHQVLLSARETSFLAARFVLDAAPSTAELRRLELLCDIPEHRLYKYFNNQRFSRKRKAGSALGLDEKADREPHADSQLQPVQSSGTASRRIDITALVQMQAAASVRVDAITAAAAAAAACACAAAASDSQQPGVTVPLLPDSQQPGVTGPLLLKPPESTFAAAAAAVLVPAAAGVSDADLNEQLAFHLAAPTLSIDAAAQPAAAAAEPHLIVKKERPRSQSTGRMNSLTRLEVFHRWLQERRIDPFSCAHRCDSVLRLALLVEQYGRSSNSTSFVFAGICVLQAAFEQSSIAPPDSLSSWQQLLSLTPETARLSRQSDSLWYHVRRGGPAFCESVPTKAREDTLTALAIIAAIAPHHQAMAELVGRRGDWQQQQQQQH